MRLSSEHVKSLQTQLKELYGLELTNEQAQATGMSIIRLVIAKANRKQELAKRDKNYGKISGTDGTVAQ